MILDTVDGLQSYLMGAKRRADHHGPSVNRVLFLIAGALVCFKDRHSDIEVREHKGRPAVQLSAQIGGRRLVFGYNHTTGAVKIHENTQQGPVLAEFTNQTKMSQVIGFFEELRPKAKAKSA